MKEWHAIELCELNIRETANTGPGPKNDLQQAGRS
jgi:hypothetical protein